MARGTMPARDRAIRSWRSPMRGRAVKRGIMAARPLSCISPGWFDVELVTMPFAGGRYRFTRSMVEGAPADPGVYALWENDELIYYGRASGNVISIQFALFEHLSGRAGPCTQRATHYGWEIGRASCRERV